VIQEVALATGRVQVQCGHNMCDFEEFASTQSSIILKHSKDKALKDDYQHSEHFLTTIGVFQYSSFNDREGFFTKKLSSVMMRTICQFFQSIEGFTGQRATHPNRPP